MNTKTDGISSGLVAVAWMVEDLQMLFFDHAEAESYCDEDDSEPLVRLSDAEALIAEKDAEIRRLVQAVADHVTVRSEQHGELVKLCEEVARLTKERDIKEHCIVQTELEVERLTRERDEWKNDAINGGNAGYLREQVATLTAALEEAQEDAERYRLLRRGQHWSVIDGIGDTLRADTLDVVIDAALKGEKE